MLCSVCVAFAVYTAPMSNQYQAYLLRMQRSQHAQHWRVTLENAHTGEVLRFVDEMALMRHLLRMFEPSHSNSGVVSNDSST